MNYMEYGKENKEVIVLLHGGKCGKNSIFYRRAIWWFSPVVRWFVAWRTNSA